MLFLFRSAPEVEKRIHSKLFRKFWRSRGTKEPAYITVGDNFRCTTFKKIKAVEAVKIWLPLSRLGRVTQFVGFALVMSLALLALAAATQMLAWGWRYIAVQVFTGWQKLAAFRREQKWPQNFRQARIRKFRDKCIVFAQNKVAN